VCIPAYNEQNLIVDVIRQVRPFVDEIVVCDDGSTDETEQKARSEGVHVIRHQKNLGKGGAMKSLFDYAKNIGADIMITMDGDGQFLPEEIPRMMEPVIKQKADVVLGYRFDDANDMPTYRKFGNKFLDKMTSLASELPFRDTQGGFRAYSKKAIQLIQFSTNGFGVDSEIVVNASKQNLKIVEEKVTVIYNTGGKTSTKTPVVHISEVLKTILEMVAIYHPLKYLGIPGLFFIIIGMFVGIFVLITFNDTRYFSIPFMLISIATTILGLLLLLMSVVLFSISKSVNQKS
jgi:glycosyltransferase involved in cell wall biosynthesis